MKWEQIDFMEGIASTIAAKNRKGKFDDHVTVHLRGSTKTGTGTSERTTNLTGAGKYRPKPADRESL